MKQVSVYLASASPRRRQLLQQVGIGFEVILPVIKEVARPGESAEEFVMRMALEKAQAGLAQVAAENRPPAPVLGADTCIVLDDEIIGKPRDHQDGIRMLTKLAGRSHEVLTGVAVVNKENVLQVLSRSQVTFAALSADEIERYWCSGEPVDKAGGYAIQGQAAAFIERIDGSYTGIVGLPLFEVVTMLKNMGAKL